MHTSEHASEKDKRKRKLAIMKQKDPSSSLGKFLSSHWVPDDMKVYFATLRPKFNSFSGGWKHPWDQQHCLSIFGHKEDVPNLLTEKTPNEAHAAT
mmetsp:Transcript_22282/g.61908  ORF Transcript_22282/g.61908 Transcript_22282/m.61908 type:complete len:96 (+) Transcript_22282:916-1203(+)